MVVTFQKLNGIWSAQGVLGAKNFNDASYLLALFNFELAFFLNSWRRQQASDALVEVEEEGDAFGVGGVGFFATAGLVGGVYGGV